MLENKPEMVRVNTRISRKANDWLDKESHVTGVPKSTLILLAIENFQKERTVLDSMADMGQLFAKLEQLEQTVQRKGLE